MKRFLAILAVFGCLALPSLAPAQDGEEDDRSRLTALIEDQLSDGAARQIRIEGFRGALSSSATLDRLSISDANGEWLILEGAQLDWNRSALFSRALEVEALTAERLTILRAPLTEEDGLPPAEATPFSLPELPLRVEIGEIAVERLELGAALLGQRAVFTLGGSARLADGAGEADLSLRRLDGPEGVFDLAADYANETRNLTIDLSLQEEAGGIATDLLGIPGQPSLGLTVSGDGPIDDITVVVALSTEGQPRVTGAITSQRADPLAPRSVVVDIGGDLLPLLDESLHPFFGPRSTLAARIDQDPTGAIALSDLSLSTRALTLTGEARIGANGQPRLLDLEGVIGDPASDAPVPLPGGGGEITLREARLDLAFDAAAGQSYTLVAGIDDLAFEGVRLGTTRVRLAGAITTDSVEDFAVSGAVVADIGDIDIAEPALAETVGESVAVRGSFDWQQGEELDLSDLTITLGDVTLEGPISFDIDEGRADLSVEVRADIPRLSRFAALSGQPLRGAARLDLSAQADLLSGAFDAELRGSATDLVVADGVASSLFAGETDLVVVARRDALGLTLPQLELTSRNVTVSASGAVTSEDGRLSATGRLRDLALLTDAISGPADIDIDLTRTGEAPWQVRGSLDGPGGLRALASGVVGQPGGAVDLRLTGTAPLALANRFIIPRSIRCTAEIDLNLRGQPGLDALSGQVRTTGARLALPTLQAAVEGIDATITLGGGAANIDASGAWSSGGRIAVSGRVDLGSGSLPGDLSVSLSGLRLVDPTLYELVVADAALTFRGPLAGRSTLAGTIRLGESEIRVPEAGIGGAAAVPDIAFAGETAAQRRTRLNAGLTDGDGGTATGGGGGSGAGGIALDLDITAPGRIFLRGRGIDAEFGGAIRLAGDTGDVIPIGRFELIRGRIALLGTRLDITEGSATLQGDFDPYLRLRAESRAGEYRVFITLDGPASDPEIGFSSEPGLPEDEVLAQLLFGRSVAALSPVQLVQLADAAASLAGGPRNAGFLANLRDGLGLDDLDLQTDEEGNAAIRAGRYISENVYSDVTIGADGEADVSLNIDLTPNITARGTVSAEGDSSIGLFFERDY